MKAAALIAAVVAVVVLAVVVIDSGNDEGGGTRDGGSESGDLLSAVRALHLPEIDLEPVPPKVPGPHFTVLRVQSGAKVPLYDAPGGSRVAEITDETEFGSPRSLSVAKKQRGWFAAPVPELPNGQLAWIQDDRSVLEVYETPFWIVADVSSRALELRYGKRILDRFPVTVGSPGSPTPLGRYSVTDGLVGAGVGPYYGCCVLALTGHQPNLPPNWIGGDRIAIHGTPSAVGGADSAGCLRAGDPDMVSLFARVPLGAPVFIQA